MLQINIKPQQTLLKNMIIMLPFMKVKILIIMMTIKLAIIPKIQIVKNKIIS